MNIWIDYREVLRSEYEKLQASEVNKNKSAGNLISQGFAFYDWCQSIEKEYRQSKGLTKKGDLVSDQDVYKYYMSNK